ncbi:hypothetical protein [Chryseobacterium pennipullorum]|uniref:Uncharacterized protein n=1 Tax=Chryseobacterium pennipullorum TaxID=2258963 RepID=A0A3D9B8N7_9FLAO|nr:hypothetical protein [Chryseobacterium pennipullorum]REC50010.1 hypothetical protein DRF67_00245 [Chryseobacterium pennipullorum]
MKNTMPSHKIITYLSLLMAGLFFFEFIKEFCLDLSFMEISAIAAFTTVLIIGNVLISVLLLTGKVKPSIWSLLFQIVLLIYAGWALYQIYVSSVVVTGPVYSH